MGLINTTSFSKVFFFHQPLKHEYQTQSFQTCIMIISLLSDIAKSKFKFVPKCFGQYSWNSNCTMALWYHICLKSMKKLFSKPNAHFLSESWSLNVKIWSP